MIEVYHGGVEKIEKPLAKIGRDNLDFGKGFYVTRRLQQAKEWAERTARQRIESPVVNIYSLDIDKLEIYRYKKFEHYDREWLNFIVSCRKGYDAAIDYDCVEGGVANDRVIDTVEGFINGTIDEEHAIRELSKHSPNNQICILNQEIIDKYLEAV
ncbi:MAG: DUF3990 domain-containing protein [Paludibacteraceae bacterium]|nr:DUF3990 domain-containing protein [Paludibacteraceae bacterium]